MEFTTERTPVEWFYAAARWYLEGHQGCPSCRGQHCVFRSAWGHRLEYFCSACDFSACHDGESGRYFAAPGDGRRLADTLLSRDGPD